MKDFDKYFIMGISALLPLINPPGSALELPGVVGSTESKSFTILAKKIAINTTFFLMVVALAAPYALKFFGISVEALQLVGGAVLAAMGWSLLNKPASEPQIADPAIRRAVEDRVANSWQYKLFYALTFPVIVGPGSIAVMQISWHGMVALIGAAVRSCFRT